ncbi:MAG: glycyl-radical enzyme activating protein [Bacteroidales bacterium]
MKGKISNIQRFSIHDGPGIRTTVFFQGCPLSCWWCHNPECIGFDAGDAKNYTPEELIEEIKKDKIFFEESGGGVTFSGGEPLSQPGFLLKVIELCHQEKIHAAIDTSGYAEKEQLKKFLQVTDLFLYDLKLIDGQLHKKYTGVGNEQILENLRFLDENNTGIEIRIPLIPGITDTRENIRDIRDFIHALKHQHEVQLHPYHKIAEGKYERLKLEYKLKGVKQSEDRLEEIRRKFEI